LYFDNGRLFAIERLGATHPTLFARRSSLLNRRALRSVTWPNGGAVSFASVRGELAVETWAFSST
jgi:hypothetical protein